MYQRIWKEKGILPMDLAKQTPTQISLIAADSGTQELTQAEFEAIMAGAV